VESAVRIAERSGAELLVVATETGASARILLPFVLWSPYLLSLTTIACNVSYASVGQ